MRGLKPKELGLGSDLTLEAAADPWSSGPAISLASPADQFARVSSRKKENTPLAGDKPDKRPSSGGAARKLGEALKCQAARRTSLPHPRCGLSPSTLPHRASSRIGSTRGTGRLDSAVVWHLALSFQTSGSSPGRQQQQLLHRDKRMPWKGGVT